MARLLRLFVFAGAFVAVQPAFGQQNGKPNLIGLGRRTNVPELSSHGAVAGLALIGGAAAIVLGRRRARRQ